MYSLFQGQEPGEIIQFMQEHPFAMVIGVNTAGQPVATEIPVLWMYGKGKFSEWPYHAPNRPSQSL